MIIGSWWSNLRAENWTADANCTQSDPEVFFPERGQSSQDAKKICRDCPVTKECLEYAVTEPRQRYGVWGGLTETERGEFMRKRRLGAQNGIPGQYWTFGRVS